MISLRDWLMDLSKNYSVQHIDAAEGAIVGAINEDYVLVKNSVLFEIEEV